METSALSNSNIEKAFKLMIEEIYKKVAKSLDEESGDHGTIGASQNVFDIKSGSGSDLPKKKNCC